MFPSKRVRDRSSISHCSSHLEVAQLKAEKAPVISNVFFSWIKKKKKKGNSFLLWLRELWSNKVSSVSLHERSYKSIAVHDLKSKCGLDFFPRCVRIRPVVQTQAAERRQESVARWKINYVNCGCRDCQSSQVGITFCNCLSRINEEQSVQEVFFFKEHFPHPEAWVQYVIHWNASFTLFYMLLPYTNWEWNIGMFAKQAQTSYGSTKRPFSLQGTSDKVPKSTQHRGSFLPAETNCGDKALENSKKRK